MVAPLIMLAAALLSKKEQDMEQKSVYEEELRREAAAAQARIADRRAQRAGDSGYMQQAANSIGQFSKPQPSNSGAMLAQVGGALMSQRKPPKTDEIQTNKTIGGMPNEARNLDVDTFSSPTTNRYDYDPDRDKYYV